jgi:hypothetical protein
MLYSDAEYGRAAILAIVMVWQRQVANCEMENASA